MNKVGATMRLGPPDSTSESANAKCSTEIVHDPVLDSRCDFGHMGRTCRVKDRVLVMPRVFGSACSAYPDSRRLGGHRSVESQIVPYAKPFVLKSL